MDDLHPILDIVIIILLLVIKAIISNAKSAIGNVNENEVRKEAEENNSKPAYLVLELFNKPPSYIYAIDIIITIISVTIGFVYCKDIYYLIDNWLITIVSENFIIRFIIHILCMLILVSFVVLVGSLIPKKLALYNTERKAYNTINTIMIMTKIFRPFTWLYQVMIDGFIKFIGLKPEELVENVTEEEIISMVNEGHEQGVLEEKEVKMINRIIEFDEKEVRDIMTHRKNIIAVESSMDLKEAYEFMLSKSCSRFPLYNEELDNIVGIVHFKDVARACISEDKNKKSLKKIARKPYFVPETQSIDSLLNDMQSNKIQMAIVVDEYGQTSGLVCFEDMLEEIVGNILDEYDEEEKNIIKHASGNYIIKGLTSLVDISEELGVELVAENYETLNGFLISKLKRIPKDGEKCNVSYMGYVFEILDVKNRIINVVRVRKIK
ncbi:MAG: HlyC/CorC family transporter [Lachnospiraceae bacterium]|nr:HlyC/CorC family transporter [Lachnospiraceae bacterium]